MGTRLWYEGGAGGSGDPAGDGATAPAVTGAENGSGAEVQQPAVSDAQAAADKARSEMIDEARRAAREEWARLEGSRPAAPAAPPPTANRREVAELHAEHAALQAEQARLDADDAALQAAIRDKGLTADNLYLDSQLTRRAAALARREARFAAQVNLVGLQESERRQAIDSRAPKDDEARARAFKAYAAEHPNADPDMVEMAFATKWSREHPEKAAPAAAKAATPAGREAVNVSGPSEVSAREARARTMTREQANQQRARFRAEGRDSDAANLDREIRTGKVLIKG